MSAGFGVCAGVAVDVGVAGGNSISVGVGVFSPLSQPIALATNDSINNGVNTIANLLMLSSRLLVGLSKPAWQFLGA